MEGHRDNVHPVLFHIGDYTVYSYGVMLFCALIVALFVVRHQLGSKGIEPLPVYVLSGILVAAGLMGARLFYVLGHLEEYRGNWLHVFDFDTAGMVLYGGLIVALPVAVLAIRRLRLPLGAVLDAVGLALPMSLAIARMGCFLNGCCGGKPSGLSWAVTFPGNSVAVHPTQLYEMICDLAVFASLLLIRRRLTKSGDLFLVSIASYSVVRFVMEFFRFHSNPQATPFFQSLSVAIFVLSLMAITWRHLPGSQGHSRRPIKLLGIRV